MKKLYFKKTDLIPRDSIYEQHPILRKIAANLAPRTAQDVCLLCLKNKADKVESHIIPQFLTASIFKDKSKKRIFTSDGLLRLIPGQRTPSEKYLLCTCCEKRIGAAERLVSLFLPEFLNSLRKKEFKSGNLLLQLSGAETEVWHLFVYSILWRAHVCSQREFAALWLSSEYEETIRAMLDKCLSTKGDEMIQAMQEFYPDNLPMNYYTYVAYEKVDRSYQIITGRGSDYTSSSGLQIFANELIFIFQSGIEHRKYATGINISAINAIDWRGFIIHLKSDVAKFNLKLRSENESGDIRKG